MDRVVREDKENKYIWNISDKSLVWDSLNVLSEYLRKDLGVSNIYIAHHGDNKLGLFGLFNLSKTDKSANMVTWIDQSARSGILGMKWYIQFLVEANKSGIQHLYAKIKKRNAISIRAAKRFGFEECEFVPDHLKSSRKFEEVCYFGRDTCFNSFETKYISRSTDSMLRE
jgi:RimJ/RimL family protein N-acetyltransferase